MERHLPSALLGLALGCSAGTGEEYSGRAENLSEFEPYNEDTGAEADSGNPQDTADTGKDTSTDTVDTGDTQDTGDTGVDTGTDPFHQTVTVTAAQCREIFAAHPTYGGEIAEDVRVCFDGGLVECVDDTLTFGLISNSDTAPVYTCLWELYPTKCVFGSTVTRDYNNLTVTAEPTKGLTAGTAEACTHAYGSYAVLNYANAIFDGSDPNNFSGWALAYEEGISDDDTVSNVAYECFSSAE